MRYLGELISESEWSRQYRAGPNSTFYESKFLVDGLKIDLSTLSSRWSWMKPEERYDFALAFGAKTSLDGDDEAVLSFLMLSGDEAVWRLIALKLARHRDRDAVVQFLSQRIQQSKGSKGSYYQAAEELEDVRLLPILEEDFRHFNSSLQLFSQDVGQDPAPLREYLQLCKTLAAITGRDEYLSIIRSALEHSLPLVRRKAQLLLGVAGESEVH